MKETHIHKMNNKGKSLECLRVERTMERSGYFLTKSLLNKFICSVIE
jgi:hypothetical protein